MTFYDFRKFTSKSSVLSIFKDFLGLAMFILDSLVVMVFLTSDQHEGGNLGPKLHPGGGFLGP